MSTMRGRRVLDRATPMMTIRALYPIYCTNLGVGHTCLSVCETMRDDRCRVLLTVPSTEPVDRRDFVRDAVPHFLRSLSCRKGLRHARHWGTQRFFLQQLRPGEVAYLWPAVSPWVYEQIKARGHVIVMERVNCHRATARRILEEAYRRLGWPPTHGITDAQVAEETHKLSLADHVFCPSPFVRQSIAAAGIRPDKLLSASYGWDAGRFSGGRCRLPEIGGPTFLFVGLVCVRKGAHLLLRAWERSRLKGRLVIVGEIAPDIAARCASQLNRPDVVHIRATSDVGGVYRSADAFAFPTLEEGSPLVCYEALACGLPILTSPMGAGEVIRDGVEGMIREPYQEEAWVEALRQLGRDRALRNYLAQAARARAADYTWQQCGARRRFLLQSVLRTEEVLAHPASTGRSYA